MPLRHLIVTATPVRMWVNPKSIATAIC